MSGLDAVDVAVVEGVVCVVSAVVGAAVAVLAGVVAGSAIGAPIWPRSPGCGTSSEMRLKPILSSVVRSVRFCSLLIVVSAGAAAVVGGAVAGSCVSAA